MPIKRIILCINIFLLMVLPLQGYAALTLDNTAGNAGMPDCEMHSMAMEMGLDMSAMQDMPACQSADDCQSQCDGCAHCPVAAVITFFESTPANLNKEMPLAKEVKLFLTYLNKDLRPPRVA